MYMPQFRRNNGDHSLRDTRLVVADEGPGSRSRLAVIAAPKVRSCRCNVWFELWMLFVPCVMPCIYRSRYCFNNIGIHTAPKRKRTSYRSKVTLSPIRKMCDHSVTTKVHRLVSTKSGNKNSLYMSYVHFIPSPNNGR